MKTLFQIIRHGGMETIILLMIAAMTVGTVVTTVFQLNTPDGSGTFIGTDVRDTGTNAWQ